MHAENSDTITKPTDDSIDFEEWNAYQTGVVVAVHKGLQRRTWNFRPEVTQVSSGYVEYQQLRFIIEDTSVNLYKKACAMRDARLNQVEVMECRLHFLNQIKKLMLFLTVGAMFVSDKFSENHSETLKFSLLSYAGFFAAIGFSKNLKNIISVLGYDSLFGKLTQENLNQLGTIDNLKRVGLQ